MDNKIKEEVDKALDVLKKGGVILYPTDTIWGIGCDATNEKAVQRVYEIKKRDDSKSMIVLLDNEARLPAYIDYVPEQAWDLIEYSDKPLTVILSGARNVAKNIIAEDGTIGVRITKDEFCRKLVERLRKPIVSTSANISGEASPQNFSEVSAEIKSSVDYVVDLRQEETEKKAPSRIIKVGKKGEIKIIR